MLEPPDLSNEVIVATVRAHYGIAVGDATFLPIGHDPLAWVYRLRAADGRAYFLKVRAGIVNEAVLSVPRYLHDRGVADVVAPLPTISRALWVAADGFALIHETTLAPKERDLMFVVGGISTELVGPREEAWFFRGYGPTAVDPLALAYYRYAWAVGDIGAYGEQALSLLGVGAKTRRAAVQGLMSLFEPGRIVALAYAADGSGF